MRRPSQGKGNGAAMKWLRAHTSYDYDECLLWPFSRHKSGYGNLGYLGKQYYAHRMMCELVNGPAPSDTHECAHSCGRGHDGCVHPAHLSWKTISENLLDCRQHGTHSRNKYGRRGRLDPLEVMKIRAMKGQKTQAEIAAEFGITAPSVRDIFLGRTYKQLSS